MIWYILSYSPFSGDGQKHPKTIIATPIDTVIISMVFIQLEFMLFAPPIFSRIHCNKNIIKLYLNVLFFVGAHYLNDDVQ